jgi:hypothetical protein
MKRKCVSLHMIDLGGDVTGNGPVLLMLLIARVLLYDGLHCTELPIRECRNPVWGELAAPMPSAGT